MHFPALPTAAGVKHRGIEPLTQISEGPVLGLHIMSGRF